jgi:hypothetical protein
MTTFYFWFKNKLSKLIKQKKSTTLKFQEYCQNNPSAPECRIYDL